MGRTKGSHTATFVVRLWQETGGETESTWRGQVEHVQSSKKQYVRELAQVLEFIEEHFRGPISGAKGGGIH
ncbi:MAG: hypothetical protein JXM73_25575 [Anaerolineae bacterium]|nr:hypothetical protein [Anaerolineae bacterium]